jgi:hypothetical protein
MRAGPPGGIFRIRRGDDAGQTALYDVAVSCFTLCVWEHDCCNQVHNILSGGRSSGASAGWAVPLAPLQGFPAEPEPGYGR